MDRRVTSAGFTLIELMIVVAIFAVLSTSVVLSLARPGGDARSDVAKFQAAFDQAKSEATLSRQIMALAVDESGYQRLLWQNGWTQRSGKVSWRNAVAVLAPFARDEPIAFSPSGQVTAFRVRFGNGDNARICQSNGWGPMECSG